MDGGRDFVTCKRSTMQVEVVLHPCPWCGKTPKLWMPTEDKENSGETWLWKIMCVNLDCGVRPESRHVALRNTTKFSLDKICSKLEELAHKWNDGNPRQRFEKLYIDVKDILYLIKSRLPYG